MNDTNNLFHDVDLTSLSKIRGEQGSVFSLYLGAGRDATERFEALLKEAGQPKNLDSEQWQQETDRIRQWLIENGSLQQQGAAVFSSIPAGLWQVISLPAPVCDRLVVSDRPYLRPLEILQAERKGNIEAQSEMQRVEEVITRGKKGQGAVLGPEQTFLAVHAKTVRLLLAEENFCLPGGVCPNCGLISADQRGVCLLCGVALRSEPDIIAVAMQRVLDTGGEIDIVRGAEARRALAPHGRIGGLVREVKDLPEKDTANQQPITKEGKINRDVLRDETVEESFPASDAPGGPH